MHDQGSAAPGLTPGNLGGTERTGEHAGIGGGTAGLHSGTPEAPSTVTGGAADQVHAHRDLHWRPPAEEVNRG
jgi:hypothetical protein